MNKAQWITAGVAILVVIGIYAATEKEIFGPPSVKASAMEVKPAATLSVDNILFEAKTHLPQLLERVSRGEEILITKHGQPVAMLVPDRRK